MGPHFLFMGPQNINFLNKWNIQLRGPFFTFTGPPKYLYKCNCCLGVPDGHLWVPKSHKDM